MDFIKKNSKWISLGGNIISFVSLFLPFATVSANILGSNISKSVPYIDGDGIFVLIALLVASGLLFIKNNKFTLIPLGIALAVCIFSSFNVGKSVGDIGSVYGDLIKVNFGVGFYLLLVGLIISIGVIICSNFIFKTKSVSSVGTQQMSANQIYQGAETVNQTQSNQVNNPQAVISNVTCPNCGCISNSQSLFCGYCGTKLK